VGRGRFGPKALTEAVTHKHPRLHVFGHIHEARGASGIGTFDEWTVLANCSYVNWDYKPYPQPPYRFSIPQDRTKHAWRCRGPSRCHRGSASRAPGTVPVCSGLG